MKDVIKNNRLVSIIVIIILISGLLYGGYKVFFKKLDSYTEISYKEFTDKINSKEKFVLFIGSESCSHCATFKNVVNRIVKNYQIEIYYIDIKALDENEYAYINAHYPFGGTPTTIVIDNGEEYKRQTCRIEGAKNYDYVVERLEKANIIKK